jgi:probable selenate reductase FAD-binding subunit
MTGPARARLERTAGMITEYHAPATLDEAVAVKERLAESAVYLAGGTEVNSAAFTRAPEHVISLEHLGLTGIRATKTELVIGACCTIQAIIDSAEVPECIRTAGRHIANRNIRNQATIGGQLGSNKSCGNLLPALIVLEAVVEVAARGTTEAIPAIEYISGERKELILRVRIPKHDRARFVGVEKYARTANDLSVLTAAVSLGKDGELIDRPLVAAGGVAKHVIRLEAAERALHGLPLPSREVVEDLVGRNVSPIADVRGSAEFKRHLAGVLVAKALHRAYGQEGG